MVKAINVIILGFLWATGVALYITGQDIQFSEQSQFVEKTLLHWPKPMLSFLIPCLAIFSIVLLKLFERWDKGAIKAIDHTAILLFMLFVHLGIFLRLQFFILDGIAYGLTMSVMSLCYYLHFRLRQIPPNRLIGVRLPWTMNSMEVWRKTHDKMSVWMMPLFWMGLVVLIFPRLVGVYLITFVVVNFLGIPYSYWLHRRQNSA